MVAGESFIPNGSPVGRVRAVCLLERDRVLLAVARCAGHRLAGTSGLKRPELGWIPSRRPECDRDQRLTDEVALLHVRVGQLPMRPIKMEIDRDLALCRILWALRRADGPFARGRGPGLIGDTSCA